MAKEQYLTEEGLKQKEEELEYLKTVVKVGSNVRFKDMDTDEFLEYQIVGVVEADPFNGKISNESPVGRAMIGRKRNQVVEVEAPSGIKKYKITKIS